MDMNNEVVANVEEKVVTKIAESGTNGLIIAGAVLGIGAVGAFAWNHLLKPAGRKIKSLLPDLKKDKTKLNAKGEIVMDGSKLEEK